MDGSDVLVVEFRMYAVCVGALWLYGRCAHNSGYYILQTTTDKGVRIRHGKNKIVWEKCLARRFFSHAIYNRANLSEDCTASYNDRVIFTGRTATCLPA